MSENLQPELKADRPFRFAAGILLKATAPVDWVMLGAAIACVLAASVLAAAAPVCLKYLHEALTPGGPGSQVSATAADPGFWLIAYVTALSGGRIAGETRTVLFGIAEQSITRSLSRLVCAHAVRLPMKFHLGRSTGAVVQILENGLLGYRLILQHGLFTLLPGIVEIALIAVLVLHFFDPLFLGVFGICAAAYAFAFSDGSRRVLRASRLVSEARTTASAHLYDGLLNIETVKAFCGEDIITRRYDARIADTQARWGGLYRARFFNGGLVALIFSGGLGLTLWMAAARVSAGAMTVGDLVLVNMWMLQLVRPLELLGFGFRDIGQGTAFVEQLNRFLREEPEDQRGAGAEIMTCLCRPPSIRFENVSFAYEEGRLALDSVSFEIESGTVVALVGPSGSGKSSIIRLLMKFFEPDEGRILIDGVDIRDCSVVEVRKLIALVAQDTALFNDSLAFNMSFPVCSLDPARLARAADQVNLGEMISRLPHGYDTPAGERGLKLSGGEKQRLAIARALLRQARVLLADEATSAIDYGTEQLMRENGVFAGGSATCVLVAHRLASIAHAQDIIVLIDGRIAERGTHSDLCRAEGIYAEMWRAQVQA